MMEHIGDPSTGDPIAHHTPMTTMTLILGDIHGRRLVLGLDAIQLSTLVNMNNRFPANLGLIVCM